MNQLGWLLLLSLIIWARCDDDHHQPRPPIELTPIKANGTSPIVVVEVEQDDDDQPEEDEAEEYLHSASSVEPTNGTVGGNDNLANGISIAQLFRSNPHLLPHLERLKASNPQLFQQPPSDGEQRQVFDTVLRRIVAGSINHTTQPQYPQNVRNPAMATIPWKHLFNQHLRVGPENYSNTMATTTTTTTTSTTPMTLLSTSEEVVGDGGYNANHNYGDTTSSEWAPMGLPPPSLSRVLPSPHYDQQHLPGSMSNFYLASSSQPIPETSAASSSKLSSSTTTATDLSTSKQLISVKDDKAFKQQQSKESEEKFNKYLSCCEQLFKEYGNKDYHHEEVYLMPPASARYPPHLLRAHQHHMMRQHPMAFMKHFVPQASGYKPHLGFLRGHPIITMEKIDADHQGDNKKEMIGEKPKIPIECKFESEHSSPDFHHIHPAAYHSSHHVPMFHPPPPPPASYILKKKLALLGKKYLLG